jgi:hypothetical protein
MTAGKILLVIAVLCYGIRFILRWKYAWEYNTAKEMKRNMKMLSRTRSMEFAGYVQGRVREGTDGFFRVVRMIKLLFGIAFVSALGGMILILLGR